MINGFLKDKEAKGKGCCMLTLEKKVYNSGNIVNPAIIFPDVFIQPERRNQPSFCLRDVL